ncbi:hypothetical protein JEQ12_015239 [Ovis aries]|uniref:Uncharacterized protein n=1 Tax=Ovis aries TaxID=9940 RepID=A0A836D627_SHEEP|nr:hypothetical protein JEQ12_015239 [Ovis aries]
MQDTEDGSLIPGRPPCGGATEPTHQRAREPRVLKPTHQSPHSAASRPPQRGARMPPAESSPEGPRAAKTRCSQTQMHGSQEKESRERKTAKEILRPVSHEPPKLPGVP